MLNVISAVASGKLFSANGCNYTVTTARAIRLWHVWIIAGIAEQRDELKGIPGTTVRSHLSLLHRPPPFSSVSDFSPVSGWRQEGPLRAFKRLLKVLVRHGPYPSTATHTLHPSRPQSPLSNHCFSGCQPALL